MTPKHEATDAMGMESQRDEGLKPCPFCGGEAEIIHLDDGDNAGGSCVCCTRCQASGNVEFGRKENFVDNWNRRATTQPAEQSGAFRLVPVKPTDKMHRAGIDITERRLAPSWTAKAVWSAMVAAAPAAEQSASSPVEVTIFCPSCTAHEAGEVEGNLTWLTERTNLELDYSYGDEDEEGRGWRVHRVSGGRSDREWELISTAETPAKAIAEARAALEDKS